MNLPVKENHAMEVLGTFMAAWSRIEAPLPRSCRGVVYIAALAVGQ